MAAKKKDNGDHTPPDSTTKPSFYVGDEVLMQRKDGNFYLGTIIKIDWQREQALVKFGDNTEIYSAFGRLTKLSTGSEVSCVKCKEANSSSGNEVIVCDRCSRGYHQLCHVPSVKNEELKTDSKWECSRCQDLPDKRQLPLRKSTAIPLLIHPPIQTPPTPSSTPSNVGTEVQRKKIPYSLTDLHWDMQHRVNKENKYCYCGGGGKWFLQMLQCGRCRQWFHSRCILSLRTPIFFGDRFYVFICTHCNAGKEFLRRLEVRWIDIVHLAIFNLTLQTAKKYLDVDEDIITFLNANWTDLSLPPNILETNIAERREHVISILNSNRNRYKYSREIKKRTTMWGLKVRVPPPTPVFSLPPNKPLTDQVLSDAWSNSARLKFLPSHPSHLLPPKNYQLYPDWGKKEEQSILLGLDLLHVESRPLILPKGVPADGHNVCIKSSSPCYPESRAQIERRIKAQTLENDRLRKKRKRLSSEEKSPKARQDLPPTPPSSESNPEAPPTHDTSGDESSRGTLDSIIPPPVDFDGRNNPFSMGGCPASNLSMPMRLTPIVRPAKRQLSEKDIRITSNGEIKRRKVRRSVGKLSGRLATNGRARLRARSSSGMPGGSVPGSPVKVAPGLSPGSGGVSGGTAIPSSSVPGASSSGSSPYQCNVEDLKSSMNHYFGAVNRIASGEKFTIRARRILPDGKTQYLIDWGCSPT